MTRAIRPMAAAATHRLRRPARAALCFFSTDDRFLVLKGEWPKLQIGSYSSKPKRNKV